MDITKADTALVVIDPQNDVLSETGVSWPLVGASVRENNTVENLDRLFRAAKHNGYGVFVSPHYLYPHDQKWGFGGPVERMMLDAREFFRDSQLAPAEAGGRLAGPLQAVHRRRRDGGGEPAQGVGAADERPGVPAS
jgi:nicotinamidase-related amidase